MNNSYIIPNWPAPTNVRAYSTTRLGGQSKPPYDSFNFGYSSGDDKVDIEKNRAKLQNDLALPNEPVWLHQVHGSRIINADEANVDKKADASYTTRLGTVCLIMTADCMPILFCDKSGTQVAAAHAGWRGMASGVIEATLASFHCSPNNILAWLGPTIGPTKFEVGNEVRQQFIDSHPAAQAAFKLYENSKWLCDLYLLARQRLHSCGITQIYGGDFCTFTDQERFFSHRRDHGKTGRMASLIWLQAF